LDEDCHVFSTVVDVAFLAWNADFTLSKIELDFGVVQWFQKGEKYSK
jgi:hypothetical protein